jgi:hypothetical protein
VDLSRDLLLDDLLSGLRVRELLRDQFILSQDFLSEETELALGALFILGIDVKEGKHQ